MIISLCVLRKKKKNRFLKRMNGVEGGGQNETKKKKKIRKMKINLAIYIEKKARAGGIT